jgi:hypothetical protein
MQKVKAALLRIDRRKAAYTPSKQKVALSSIARAFERI